MPEAEGDDKDTAVVYVEVPKPQKERWQEYLETAPDANNLTHLVKLSVETFISDDDGTIEVGELKDAVKDTHLDLERRIDELDDQLDTIQSAVHDDPDLEALKADIYEKLPRLSENEVREMSMAGGADDWNMLQSHPAGLVKDFEGRNVTRIKEACEQLRIGHSSGVRVHEEEETGTRYYYVEE